MNSTRKKTADTSQSTVLQDFVLTRSTKFPHVSAHADNGDITTKHITNVLRVFCPPNDLLEEKKKLEGKDSRNSFPFSLAQTAS